MSDSKRKAAVLNMFCIGMAVLLVFGICLYFLIKESNVSELRNLDDEIQKQETALNQLNADAEAVDHEVVSEVSGLDMARVQSDDIKAEAFLKKVLTWGSYEEYNSIRESLMSEYDLTDDSDFMTTFLPAIPVVEDADGNKYNVIDKALSSGEELNLKFVSMTSHVTGIVEDSYSYFTEVSVSSNSVNGGTAIGRCIFEYTVSEDGKLSDLHGYTIAN